MENVSTAENSAVLNRLGALPLHGMCFTLRPLCACSTLLSILGLSVLISHEAEWIFTILASTLAIAAAFGAIIRMNRGKSP